jgi:hypothetical protein
MSASYTRASPSPRYQFLQEQYREMHRKGDVHLGTPPEYVFSGISLHPQMHRIKRMIDATGAQTILDYGCGKGTQYDDFTKKPEGVGDAENVMDFWNVDSVHCYDPCFERFNKLPTGKFEGVISTDVLEHCPEDDLRWIIDEIFGYAEKFVFANVACYPAKKRLPSGENAHCTIRPVEWWSELVSSVAAGHKGLMWEFWIQHIETQNGAQRLIEKRIGSE